MSKSSILIYMCCPNCQMLLILRALILELVQRVLILRILIEAVLANSGCLFVSTTLALSFVCFNIY